MGPRLAFPEEFTAGPTFLEKLVIGIVNAHPTDARSKKQRAHQNEKRVRNAMKQLLGRPWRRGKGFDDETSLILMGHIWLRKFGFVEFLKGEIDSVDDHGFAIPAARQASLYANQIATSASVTRRLARAFNKDKTRYVGTALYQGHGVHDREHDALLKVKEVFESVGGPFALNSIPNWQGIFP